MDGDGSKFTHRAYNVILCSVAKYILIYGEFDLHIFKKNVNLVFSLSKFIMFFEVEKDQIHHCERIGTLTTID